jgi:cyclopropane fatty-acyl-phospholipid synthase-like methyltransferase
MNFDLALFEQLNKEYESRPLVKKPRVYDQNALSDRGLRQATRLTKTHQLRGKKVLEIGCGRAEILQALAERFDCQCVGVDVSSYPQWKEASKVPSLRLLKADISQDAACLAAEKFDFIFSSAVWEHVRHPFAMLEQARNHLATDGELFIHANLHRGPKASHRYRQIFFPWPHLLFTDGVVEQFYVKHYNKQWKCAWVNRLTAAHYLLYFQLLGLRVKDLKYSITPLDHVFYRRFENILSRYPLFDLERDFITARLCYMQNQQDPA